MMAAAEINSGLHVLTLTPFFPSDQNEVTGCFVAEPMAEFAQFGVDSSVIAVSAIHHPRRHSIASSAAEWVRYPQIPGTLGLSSAGKLLYARLLKRVRGLHRTKRIDVIHAHAALPCGHAAMLLSRRLKIPFVVTVHGLDVFNDCYLGGTPAEWRRRVSVEVYGAARNVVCVSGKVQEILKTGTAGETRSSIIYNGVNPNLFSPSQDGVVESAQEILSVGMLLDSKGHEVVLRALAKLRRSFPQLHCRFIGEGPDRGRLEAVVRELAIEQHVQFVARESRAKVAESMRRSSIFALASRNEGLGCVYLEAMSCGKPVIGCRGQGIDEVIEHGTNGLLIPAGGLAELEAGLSALLGSSELRGRFGAAARQTILDRFTLAHQAEQLATTYRRAIA
jgi:teichuronic acid biosynthesis glycosyltransferase TuaC